MAVRQPHGSVRKPAAAVRRERDATRGLAGRDACNGGRMFPLSGIFASAYMLSTKRTLKLDLLQSIPCIIYDT